MSNITLYTEANFQGDSVSLPAHQFVLFFDGTSWLFRSAKLNSNKLLIETYFKTFDPTGSEENYFNEDIADFAAIIEDTINVGSVSAIGLLHSDVIVSMQASVNLDGYGTQCTSVQAELKPTYNSCYSRYTPEPIPGTLAIMNADALDTVTIALAIFAQPIRIADKRSIVDYQTDAEIKLTYDKDKREITVLELDKFVTHSIEKIDDMHFMVRFEFMPVNTTYVRYYKDEEYRGEIDIQVVNSSAELRNEEGTFIYKSAALISDQSYPFYWAQTSYIEGGAGYDFNSYKSHVFTDNEPYLEAVFDETTSNVVRSVVSNFVIPVFVRLTNTMAPNSWQGFVIESSFTTGMLVVPQIPLPVNYYTFCSNNPTYTQPSLLCVVGHSDDYNDISACTLRYGSLDSEGEFVTWNGEVTLNIDYASTDTLTLSLNSDAPADWSIDAITRGEDGWYVDLSGSVESTL
ncbi:hypothetical protein C3369_19130 [Escherichia sp. ESNIH1]|uniref:hypothetical protein n=1 Tax=Escherichia sp. ESNIH1 TaxID=1985876 RepID=UPI000CDE52EF|nr:hypothetical protein [Escherichia sp. ESNIH1]POT97992.1 hypothetical protein C3369_19130 [Escherichia sp. ESNIH1]